MIKGHTMYDARSPEGNSTRNRGKAGQIKCSRLVRRVPVAYHYTTTSALIGGRRLSLRLPQVERDEIPY